MWFHLKGALAHLPIDIKEHLIEEVDLYFGWQNQLF